MRERFEILLVLVWWIHSLFSLSLSFVVVIVLCESYMLCA